MAAVSSYLSQITPATQTFDVQMSHGPLCVMAVRGVTIHACDDANRASRLWQGDAA